MTEDLYRGEYASDTVRTDLVRHVAVDDGTIAGAMSLEAVTWLQKPHVYFVRLAVLPEWRHRGVGRQLGACMDASSGMVGAAVLYVKVREADVRSERFAALRGFTPTGDVDRVSRLDVARAALDGLPASRAGLRDRGIRIARLSELAPDDSLLRVVHAVTEESAADVPSAEPFGGDTFEHWRHHFIERPGMSMELIWVALDGNRPVATAHLRRYSREEAGNSYTGVLREYRGRGIARALKLEQIAWARDNGVRSIYTGNDANNSPMLAINRALGYEFLPAQIEWGKEL